jgi:hypothetical protein
VELYFCWQHTLNTAWRIMERIAMSDGNGAKVTLVVSIMGGAFGLIAGTVIIISLLSSQYASADKVAAAEENIRSNRARICSLEEMRVEVQVIDKRTKRIEQMLSKMSSHRKVDK